MSIQMKIRKSTGTTDSERLLASMCEKTFLGFWSYANPFRNQGDGKELCDLLVVCGNHIIIFSDKSCEFPNSGNDLRDWSRWYRRAIEHSAKQLKGAERWIRNFPDRIFLDEHCTQKLPITLPKPEECHFHFVLVSLGAAKRCRDALNGSGSLYLKPSIIPKAHYDNTKYKVKPFHIGMVVNNSYRFHVFDEVTLPLVLEELDTITDFVAYLEFKESFLNSVKIDTIFGEENLLALFLCDFTKTTYWKDLIMQTDENSILEISDQTWHVYKESVAYKERKTSQEYSYIWDNIIKEFATHSFDGTLVEGSPLTISDNETIFRRMASEPRLSRTFLAFTMLERWHQYEAGRVDYRIVQSPTHEDTLYVFLFVPKDGYSETDYRNLRRKLLASYCFLVAYKQLKHSLILGIATQAGEDLYRTFDVIALRKDAWLTELKWDRETIRKIEEELGVTGEGTIHYFDQKDSI